MEATTFPNFQKCGEILIDINTKDKKNQIYIFHCTLCNVECDQIKKFSLHIGEEHLKEFENILTENELKVEAEPEKLQIETFTIIEKMEKTSETPLSAAQFPECVVKQELIENCEDETIICDKETVECAASVSASCNSRAKEKSDISVASGASSNFMFDSDTDDEFQYVDQAPNKKRKLNIERKDNTLLKQMANTNENSSDEPKDGECNDFFVAFSGSWCVTVPKSWINSDDKIITRPHKKINATLACKKPSVPRDDWETFKYDKLLGPYDNFDTARAAEIAAVDMSRCDEPSVNRETTTKTRRKQPARFDDSFSSSNRDSDEDENTVNRKDKGKELYDSDTVKLPPFGGIGGKSTTSVDKNFQKHKSLSEYNLGKNKHLNNPESKSRTNHGDGTENVINPNLHDDSNVAGSSTSKKSVLTPREPSLPRNNDSIDHVNSTTAQSSECHNCCPACRSILNCMSRKLDALLNMHADNPRPTTTQQANVLPDFPISNYEDLAKFNELLADKEVARTQYEDLIKQRRNANGKKWIRSVLGYILTDELCCKLSWSGQKKTIKVENMSLVELLRDAVLSNSRSSLHDCKQAIMYWLQHANDRVKINRHT